MMLILSIVFYGMGFLLAVFLVGNILSSLSKIFVRNKQIQKMVSITIYIVSGLFVFWVAIIIYAFFTAENDQELSEFEKGVRFQIERHDTGTLELDGLINFNWDRLCVVLPYQTDESVSNYLNLSEDQTDRLFLWTGQYWGLVFFNGLDFMRAERIHGYYVGGSPDLLEKYPNLNLGTQCFAKGSVALNYSSYYDKLDTENDRKLYRFNLLYKDGM